MSKHASPKELRRFGRQHAGEGGYRSALGNEIYRLTISLGLPYGFLMWLLFNTAYPDFNPSVWIFAIGGGLFGLGMAVTSAPGTLRLIIKRETTDPHALVSEVRSVLERKGYEPVEISDRHCKMDPHVSNTPLSLGPITLTPPVGAVTLVTDEGEVTFAGPCEILSKIVDPPRSLTNGNS